jgi:hypothetical protein
MPNFKFLQTSKWVQPPLLQFFIHHFLTSIKKILQTKPT